VPRIRLRIEVETLKTPCHFLDPDSPGAGPQNFPFLRLATMVRVDPPPSDNRKPTPFFPFAALIDTGAPISAVETETWEALDRAGLLRHLPFERHQTHAVAIGGRSVKYKLGQLWISLLDLQPPDRPPGTPIAIKLPTTKVIAQLLLDQECKLPHPLVLGLHRGVLDGRKLVREPTRPLPGPIPPYQTSDCGDWYGQQWYLETTRKKAKSR
jgi:hypothetical protein